jgi:hypothetical protein
MALEGVLRELMHNKYTEGVQDQLNNKHPIRSRFEKDFSRETYEGSRVIDAVQLGRNSVGRWVKEQDSFPLAGNAVVKNTAIFCSWFRTSGQVAYTTKQRTKTRAFAQAMSVEMVGIKDDTANKMERAACMDGSGLLAKIDVITAGGNAFQVPATKAVRLEEGMPVWFVNVGATTNFDGSTTTVRANPSGQNYYTIANIDFDGATPATITDEFGHVVPAARITTIENLSTTVVDNDYVVTAGALVTVGSQVFSTEEMGIGGIIGLSRNYTTNPYDTPSFGATFQTATDDPSPGATDDFHGLSPVTYAKWRPVAYNASGGDIDPRLFERIMTLIKTRSGKSLDEITDIYVNSIQVEIWRKSRYSEERVALMPDRGIESGDRGMPSSRSERMYPTYAGIPIVDGRYFDDDKAYIVMRKYLRLMILEAFQLWTLGDGGFHKAYDRTPAVHFEWQGFEQFAGKCRNCHGVIYNLSTTF